jgi:hypothetical protein
MKLAPGHVEMQELTSVVDLRTLTDYLPGCKIPEYHNTTHVDLQLMQFARSKVVSPTKVIADSFAGRDDLAAIVSLSAPFQPLFDSMSDVRFESNGVFNFVRNLYEMELRTVENEVGFGSWFDGRVEPFMSTSMPNQCAVCII